MSRLPDTWVRAPLADLTVPCVQRTPAEDEEFQYIDIGSVDRETKRIVQPKVLVGREASSRARKVVHEGDVLVSMTRPNLNAVALVPDELDGQIASTGFEVLRAVEIDPRWIYYNVRARAFVDEMSKLVRGALYPAIRSKDVRAYVTPLAPLQQQREISSVLDTVSGTIDICRDRLKRTDSLIARFRSALLTAATTGRLTEEWRQGLSTADTWRTVKLGFVAGDFTYGSSAKSMEAGQVPVLRMGNIQKGRLDWKDLVFTSNESEITKYRLRNGDVLFNRTNTPELVGKTAVYHGEREAIFAGYLIRVRCREELLPDYLAHCLNSPAGRQYCHRVKADSVGQSNINARKLASFPVDLPPVEEQVEIVRRVEELLAIADALDCRSEDVRIKLNRVTLAAITRGIEGELLPVATDGESATLLLERIRAATTHRDPQSVARRMRVTRAPRAPRERTTMTKSRQDTDVKGQPYLAGFIRTSGIHTIEALFARADLPVPEFYKQLAWEVREGYIKDDPDMLEVL